MSGSGVPTNPQAVDSKPLIVTFVSGKGGVGKTMLTAAFAKELSVGSRTLMIDLDFFNRGLTGLIGATSPIANVTPPSFLTSDDQANGGAGAWNVAQVDRDLFYLAYPELSAEELKKFATLDVELLADAIREVALEAANKCQCESVVIDCHGGPDNSSFAACLVADYSLLVSEPDKITFYGTLHFVRQLEAASEGQSCDLRLVFNKVVPAFSTRYLTSLYNRSIRQYFGGRPLMGIFPLEVYLTKEFERTTFVTDVYPNSVLARKTQLLLYDLLHSSNPDKLPEQILFLPRPVRIFRKWTLGKTPALLNLEFVLRAIAICTLIAIGFGLAFEKWLNEFDWARRVVGMAESEEIGLPIALLVLAWPAVVLLLFWSKGLDRIFTYYASKRRYLRMTGAGILAGLVWLGPLFLTGGLLGTLPSLWESAEQRVGLGVVSAWLAVVGSVAYDQGTRAYRELRYRWVRVAALGRAMFAAYLVVGAAAFAVMISSF